MEVQNLPYTAQTLGETGPPQPMKISNQKPGKKGKSSKTKAPPVQKVEVIIEEESTEDTGLPKVTMHKHLRKTRFCMYHLQGACQFGTECSFAHSLEELHQTPDLRKTQLCKAYAQGGCTDETCTFAHGDDELRSTEMFFKKTLCIWHEKGKCRNGEKCRFAHGNRELRARQAAAQMVAQAAEMPVQRQQVSRQVKKKVAQPQVPQPQLTQARGRGGSSADPMKINPGGLMPFLEAPYAGMQPHEAAVMQQQQQQQYQQAQQLAARSAPPPTAASGGNLNAELSTLCQGIAILTAQCNNIQKRMELEAEFADIKRRSESMNIPLHNFGVLPSAAPTYQRYPGPQAPYPPGIASALNLSSNDLQMNEGMAVVLQAMKGGYF